MNVRNFAATRRAALRANIRDVESRIYHRRSAISIAAGGVARRLGHFANTISTRLISPGALIGAGLLGAALQRNQRLRGFGLLVIAQLLNGALRLLVKAKTSSGRERLSLKEKREYAAAESEFTAEGSPLPL